MAIMRSKRAGTCNICRGPIQVDELITWDRQTGAAHESGCTPKPATDEERSAYQKHLVAELKAWDGVGSYRPTDFGTFIHNSRVPASA